MLTCLKGIMLSQNEHRDGQQDSSSKVKPKCGQHDGSLKSQRVTNGITVHPDMYVESSIAVQGCRDFSVWTEVVDKSTDRQTLPSLGPGFLS